MLGKHSEEQLAIKRFNEIIDRKDNEIKDIKYSLAGILRQIKSINESNDYGDTSVKKRKISEICTDTIHELIIDEIKELPTTDKRNR